MRKVPFKRRNVFKKMTPEERVIWLRKYKQYRGCMGCLAHTGKLVFLDSWLQVPPNLKEWVKTSTIHTYEPFVARDYVNGGYKEFTPEPSRIWDELKNFTVWCQSCAATQQSHPTPYPPSYYDQALHV